MMSPDKYISVHTKSKLFKASNENDFIMTTYSIIGYVQIASTLLLFILYVVDSEQ